MKYSKEFRNQRLIEDVSRRIAGINPGDDIKIMEVCGTHTQSFCRFGLNKFLPKNISLIAGPGCPVCVSSQGYIDEVIRLSRLPGVIIATFGDMLRIPGTDSSLEKERARGAQVNIVYSPLDALVIAKENPLKKVIFLAVGFETTAPAYALTIMAAKKQKIKNIFFYCALKTITPAIEYLLRDEKLDISAFLCPGHVSAIIGTKPYEIVAKKYKRPCCVAGFEPLDILEGIYILVKMIVENRFSVANEYSRVVQSAGNQQALKSISRVFLEVAADWRGLGVIPKSGLKIRNEFRVFDAVREFSLREKKTDQISAKKCRCGDILKGRILPEDCKLFSRVCNPDNPVGPCMVSQEGTCSAYYKYKG
ncbi:MAG: hydrogenase formation protein HypD [Candidatus Omnitrophica bacterium]|nr:hydrogenase formation protein HypD [Candidatus Omnitrophota bacterium]